MKRKETVELMNNKYYTPSIEEFHIGFEYEVKLNNGDWIQHKLDKLSELNFEDWSVRQNNVRVKHLDEQDILELGWDRKTLEYKKLLGNKEYLYKMILWVGEKTTLEIRLTEKIIGDRYFSPPLSKTIYSGFYPKNKSELYKLMIQLGITNITLGNNNE